MKITIEIDETHPRYAMVQEALSCPIIGDAPEVSYSNALRQARFWQSTLPLVADRKIDAIKNVRAFTGLSLKDAKDLVEAL